MLRALPVTPVPCAPGHIAGISNLRGRIVTVIDLFSRIHEERKQDETPEMQMNVVVESRGELYALLVDRVGDVLALDPAEMEPPPLTLREAWRDLCTGVNKREGELMALLDLQKVVHPEDQ